MILAKVLLVAVLGSVATWPSCMGNGPAPETAEQAERRMIAAALEPKQTPRSVITTLETRTDLVFNSGQATMTTGGRQLLRSMLEEQPSYAGLRVEVFGNERDRVGDHYGRRSDLAGMRAKSLRTFLSSTKGGGWGVDEAIGREIGVAASRPADRRIVIFVLGE